MEKQDNMAINENRIERVILLIYSTYTLAMTLVSWLQGWGTWVPLVINIGMVLSLYIHFSNYKTFRFRAFFTAIMAWMNFIIDGVYTENYLEFLSTMVCMIILLSIYGIPQMVYLTVAASTFLLIYHALFVSSIQFDTVRDGVRMIFQIIAVYMAEYVSYYLIRMQVENRQMLLETIEDLEQAQRSKDDFMANVSHEIRTPINTVCGISEMVLKEDLPETVRKDIFGIQAAGRNLLSSVSDILDFSELQSGKMELVEEPYNITSTINDIMNMAIAKMEGKQLELIVDCDATIPESLYGDEQKIRRVIMNIVDNAIKFTNEGGVLVAVSARKEDYGVNLTVSVRDTGIGMTDSTIEKLFSSFNQVDTKRNRQEGGIGLGLAIAQALVNKMGGFITVKSSPGKGSEIQFVVPQKVESDGPILMVNNPEQLRVAGYIDMDKYSYALVREGYIQMIRNLESQLGVYYRHCRNLMELKRRVEKEKYSHIFISWDEYMQDQAYFDELAQVIQIVLILERDEEQVAGSGISCIYKPFYALSIATILNGEDVVQSLDGSYYQSHRFVAPEASVLVVDDNMMNLRVVEGLLRPYKMKVFVAESGQEALRKIESRDFDFVFMDHMMPEMDGVETYHRIRQKQGHYFKTVPIIALTANAIGGAREMFLAEGFADFLAKPIEITRLERILRKYIPDSKMIDIDEDVPREEQKQVVKTPQAEDTMVVEGVDTKMGINYCGGTLTDYIDIVRMYCLGGAGKIKDLRNSYEEKDWKNYRIHTHTLKSTSLGIGAVKLSELAKELELAAKEEQEEIIMAGHESMLTEFRRVLKALQKEPLFQLPDLRIEETTQNQLDEINKEALLEVLDGLGRSIETFEMEEVQAVLEGLQMFCYEGKTLEEILQSVIEKTKNFDFMGAGEELAEIQKKMR